MNVNPNLRYVNIHVVKDVDVLTAYFVNTNYAVFALENLLIKAKSQALRNQVGRKEISLW
jgi:hypothetical protein